MTERLLPYMLDCIDTCKDSKVATVEKVASMCIFPYKTKTGIRINSLKESGISWYYVKGENKETISSESYRIFADNVVKPDLATRFRQIFHEYGYVSEFSDKVIIDEHIKKMSREKDYTFLWWNCAYSVLKLWNEGDLLHDFCQATRNIQNNKFLFLQNQFDQKLKDELIQLGIFSDIKDPVSMKLFWEKLSDKEYEKARKILKKMGVPCTCLEQDNTNIVNKYILDFVKTIKQQVNFPVYQAEAGYRQCELCHELFMNWIFKESPNAFKNVVEDPEYCSGIVVQNIDGAFVPLSWSLFYSEKELGKTRIRIVKKSVKLLWRLQNGVRNLKSYISM